MTRQEFAGGQSLAAFALKLEDPERTCAASHHDAGLVSGEDFTGRARFAGDLRLPDLQ
jgi:hypothetical protein